MRALYGIVVAGAVVLAAPAIAADFASGGQGSGERLAGPAPADLRRAKPAPIPAISALAERGVEKNVDIRDAFTARGRTKDGRDLSVPFAGALPELRPAATKQERTVWPPENRTQVKDTTAPPYRQVGLIETMSANGNYYYCTGMVVGPRAVLTTAHCIYNHDEGGWPTQVTFVPALADLDTAPYGGFSYEAVYILAGYVENYQGYYTSVADWDLGLIVLDTPVGDTLGWVAFGEPASGPPATAKLVSYPGDKPPGTMWEEACKIEAAGATPALVPHDCYVQPGASGGPILADIGGAPTLIAVQTAETPDASWAMRLTPALIEWINGIAR